MKKILLISIIISSCSNTVLERKVKIFYQNGTTEIMKIQNHSNISGQPTLFNGCIYRRKHNGTIIGEESQYIGAVRCGVKYYKVLSTRRYEFK